MIIVMLGAPGSGKGTIANLLTEVLNIEHISTGDMFREAVSSGSKLGKKLEKYMTGGILVPDEIVIEALEERLSKPSAQNGAVLDGFPRTKKQAKSLEEILAKQGKKLDVVIHLIIPDEDLIDRTIYRAICSNKDCGAIYNLKYRKPLKEGICDKCGSSLYKRQDDNEETVRRRIKTYHKRTEELLKYFEEENLLYDVYLKPEDQVTTDQIKKWLKEIEGSKK